MQVLFSQSTAVLHDASGYRDKTLRVFILLRHHLSLLLPYKYAVESCKVAFLGMRSRLGTIVLRYHLSRLMIVPVI